MKQVEVYTDGACSGNPGPGGWGAVLRYRFNGKVYEKELSGGDDSTTNNRMELTAFIEALRQLKEPCEVRLCSDSQYVINGLQKGWAKNWQRRGWKKADGSLSLIHICIISSMKMMQGMDFFALSNRSRTRDAPTPTYISTKSEPEME